MMILYLADVERAGGVQQGPRGGGGGDLPASHLQAQLDQGQMIQCCGSGFGSGSRKAKMTHKHRK
jgi:hypothetical protein